MKLVSVAQMRELDRRTIEEAGIEGDELMDRAGSGVAEVVRRVAEAAGYLHPFVRLFAGRGNNGGDAFAAARVLKEMEFDVDVWLAGKANEVKGDALKHLSRMKAAEVTLEELPTKEDWDDERQYRSDADILVDGILGTGSQGPARGPAAGAIQYINQQGADALVVAIDVPSGLDADTGKASGGEAVIADVTVTMGLPKTGLVVPAALDYVGTVEVVDIGIPPDCVQSVPDAGMEMTYVSDLKRMFKRRPRASHKGTYGHVLLIGGARGYSGAISMAAKAALRSGAGLVTALVPKSIAEIVAGHSMETMVAGGPETEIGSLSSDLWKEWAPRMKEFDAILVGTGMTRHEQTLALVRQLLRDCRVPLVLDADAITVLGGAADTIAKAQCPVVMTPHPGEFGALFQEPVDKVQKDRITAATSGAAATKATIILKGAGTVVAKVGRPASINMTGNPGMATGGTGDVLAGLLTGLLGQGMDPYDAARAAAYLHGRAGDMAAVRKSQAGIVAGDLIDEIAYAYREVTVR